MLQRGTMLQISCKMRFENAKIFGLIFEFFLAQHCTPPK
jgi:hypothetical protein